MAPRPFSVPWWVILVTLGTLLSLFAPAFGLVGAERLAMPLWLRYPTIALAGALMGLIIGVAQGAALHRTVVAVPRAGWALMTTAGALVAWSLGLLPGTLSAIGSPLDLSVPRITAAVGAALAVLVLAVPTLQWLLLRRVVAKAWLWIPITVLAAAVGAGVAWVIRNLFDATAVDAGTADVALSGSLAMGAGFSLAFAAVTAVGLSWLAMQPRRAREPLPE